MTALHKSDFPDLHHLGGGKVLDICDLGESLRIVATGPISACDDILNGWSFCRRWLVAS